MKNVKSGRMIAFIWLVGVSTVALPGVALCGGSVLRDVVASLASLAVLSGTMWAMSPARVRQRARQSQERVAVRMSELTLAA